MCLRPDEHLTSVEGHCSASEFEGSFVVRSLTLVNDAAPTGRTAARARAPSRSRSPRPSGVEDHQVARTRACLLATGLWHHPALPARLAATRPTRRPGRRRPARRRGSRPSQDRARSGWASGGQRAREATCAASTTSWRPACLDRMPAAGGRTRSPAITRHYYELPRWACVHGMAENARA
ncbi:hypothetical protein C2845_PM14G18640 [Panicum miliaceum]|uniref:Uncharacterized protein n=1 Tax=Panicum miliaceum TaxID=4540 RepID=A0A3L6PQX5_PANMI|nr:hypothetical protein C2845_PM14G18640 [Panicum miliaceum]